jgi:tetratricopeptide (TPR) repeat protein
MRTSVLVRVLLTCGVVAACSAAARVAVQPTLLLQLADQHRVQKEHTTAAELYQQLTALRPNWSTPHVHLGQTYLAQGRWREAEVEFLIAQDMDSSEPGAASGLAEVAYHRGDMESAINLWRRALVLDPSDSEARYRLSRAYIDTSRFSQAEQQLGRILFQDTSHQGAHYLLGLLHAIDDPALAVQHLQMATVGADSTVTRQAVDLLGILVVGSEQMPDSQVADQLARWYLSHEMPSLALAQLDRLTELDPENYTARAYSGYALLALARPDEARETLRQVTQASPENPLGRYFLGILHRSEGYLSTALWDFKRSLRLDPLNAAGYAEIANTYQRLGQHVAAEEWYRGAVSIAPEEPGFRLLLAEFYLDVLPRPQEALIAATELAALTPDDPIALDLLGWAHFMAGQTSAAKTTLEKALALDPTLARTYYHLGVVCEELGDLPGAQRAYQRAIDLDTEGTYRERATQRKKVAGL